MASLMLVENYGRMPEECKLGNGLSLADVPVLWHGIVSHEGQLRLYQNGAVWALCGQGEVQLLGSAPPYEIRFSLMLPAKGAGMAELALLDKRTSEWREVLLTAPYESRDWVRNVGESLALHWSSAFVEVDLGEDYGDWDTS